MEEHKLTKADCVTLLQEKYQEVDRYPKRADFSEKEVVAIKAFLGPWPRALEAAGVKPPRDDNKKRRTKEKRSYK